MRYRIIKIAALRAGEKTRVARGNNHLLVTDFAIRQFIDNPPEATPLLTDHLGDEAHLIGHIPASGWSLEFIDGQAALIANAVLTRLSLDVQEGMPVSLNLVFPTDATRMDSDGYRRINQFTTNECSLLTAGDAGAMRSAKVLEVGPVVGTDHDEPTGKLATVMKAAGMTPGFSRVQGHITDIT